MFQKGASPFRCSNSIFKEEYMGEKRYIISDASKMLNVESHVLRYWEEELEIKIPSFPEVITKLVPSIEYPGLTTLSGS